MKGEQFAVKYFTRNNRRQLKGLLEIEVRIDIGRDFFVCLRVDNLLDLTIDEIVEGVNVLFDETFHLMDAM